MSDARSRQSHQGHAPRALPELCLSAIGLRLEGVLTGALLPYEGDEQYRQRQNSPDEFVYRVKGRSGDRQLLVVPLSATSEVVTQEMEPRDYQSAVARLIERRLLTALPALELRSTKHGLERIRRNDDLIESAFRRMNKARPPALAGIHKFHRTVLRLRHEFLPSRGKTFMLAVEFRRHQEVEPDVAELARRGLDLRGLEVFTRDHERRSWVGRIVYANETTCVVDADTGEVTLDATVAWLEPSTETLAHLFNQVLSRDDQNRLSEAEWAQRAAEVAGSGYIDRLGSVVQYLQKQGAIEVAPGLRVSFTDIVPLERRGRSCDATELPPVEYCFSSDRTQLDTLPARGLERFGPVDRSSFDTKEPRLLVVYPAASQAVVDGFVRQLLEGTGDDAKGAFRLGLVGTYRLNRVHTRFAAIGIDGVLGGVGSRYVEALSAELSRKAPDVVLVVIRDEDAFVEHDNPYLAAKAFLLRNGIASQEVRLSKVQSSKYDLPYILRDIAVATYAKLGGSPWTVRPTMPLSKEVVLGMAHTEFGDRHSTRARYMGITTVFNSEGTYLLAAGTARCKYDDYPRELTKSVKKTLARLASDYAWSGGDVVRLVFHTTKPLTGSEVGMVADEAVGALDKDIQIQTAFLTIEQSHPYKVLAPHEKGTERYVELLRGGFGRARVGTCAPKRGLMIDLGRHRRLLCVNGPALMKREGESIPHPLQIELHPRSTYTDMGALVRQVFHFTGLSWRSMLPVTEPVTIYYPHLIARLLGRFTTLQDWRDDLLDTRLHRSRWFL